MTSPEMQLLADYCATNSQRRAAALLGYSVTTINLALRGKYMASISSLERRVRERLGNTDNWLGALRDACSRSTQAQVAQRLGIGPTTISQALSGTYRADTVRIERRVRGELMGAACECPVMGEVSLRVCQDVQDRRPGKAGIGNPQHAQAWHACRGSGRFVRAGACPHFVDSAQRGQAAGAAGITTTDPEDAS